MFKLLLLCAIVFGSGCSAVSSKIDGGVTMQNGKVKIYRTCVVEANGDLHCQEEDTKMEDVINKARDKVHDKVSGVIDKHKNR